MPVIAGCAIFPANHIFNTAIDALPVHPSSTSFMAAVGIRNIHLDLGQQESQNAVDYYGIPYNVVNGASFTWPTIGFNVDGYSDESDCATGSAHTITSPCDEAIVTTPLMPVPASPLVESGTVASGDFDDHHLLILDSNSCRLWEGYQGYYSSGTWRFDCTATFDLSSSALRPAGWTSADAAGFPILPMLLRPDEASTGVIRHALRFSMSHLSIRSGYIWPATHGNGAGPTTAPRMGQLFRLKASYAIPSTYSTQAKAILQALKTYGMYLSDVGTSMYIQGTPSASWSSTAISQVQSVSSSEFEAVDLSAITSRTGFDINSAAVPP